MPGNFAALEAARLARDPRDRTAPVGLAAASRPDPVGTWSVARIFDDGRREPIRLNMTATAAEKLAGELRDQMTDADCSKGYNVLAQPKSTGYTFKNHRERVSSSQPSYFTPEAVKARSEHARKAARASWRGRGKIHGGGFKFMSPEKRAEISRKANDTRWNAKRSAAK